MTATCSDRYASCSKRDVQNDRQNYVTWLRGMMPASALGLEFRSAEVAQLVEHVTENHGVGSSILPLGTNRINNLQ